MDRLIERLPKENVSYLGRVVPRKGLADLEIVRFDIFADMTIMIRSGLLDCISVFYIACDAVLRGDYVCRLRSVARRQRLSACVVVEGRW